MEVEGAFIVVKASAFHNLYGYQQTNRDHVLIGPLLQKMSPSLKMQGSKSAFAVGGGGGYMWKPTLWKGKENWIYIQT